ncbi:kelch domain-containing protein 9-like isoform X2 [Rhinoraja longicauda]
MPLGEGVVLTPSLAVEGVVRGGPARSHHGTAVLQGRSLLLVGGWDGRRRISDLHAIELGSPEPGPWRALQQKAGTQSPVGLSGHTVTQLTERRLWVVGREGGVHTQRRFASIFQLHVDIQRGQYWYEEQASRVVSRSGHSASLCRRPGRVGGTVQLLLFGGRNSQGFEEAGAWNERSVQAEPTYAPGLVARLSSLISEGVVTPGTPTSRRHHSTAQVGPFVVLHGGECFNKAVDTIRGDLYIYDTRPSVGQWYQFPASEVELRRVGHRLVVLGEQLCAIGGLGPDGKHCPPDIYTLAIHP